MAETPPNTLPQRGMTSSATQDSTNGEDDIHVKATPSQPHTPPPPSPPQQQPQSTVTPDAATATTSTPSPPPQLETTKSPQPQTCDSNTQDSGVGNNGVFLTESSLKLYGRKVTEGEGATHGELLIPETAAGTNNGADNTRANPAVWEASDDTAPIKQSQTNPLYSENTEPGNTKLEENSELGHTKYHKEAKLQEEKELGCVEHPTEVISEDEKKLGYTHGDSETQPGKKTEVEHINCDTNKQEEVNAGFIEYENKGSAKNETSDDECIEHRVHTNEAFNEDTEQIVEEETVIEDIESEILDISSDEEDYTSSDDDFTETRAGCERQADNNSEHEGSIPFVFSIVLREKPPSTPKVKDIRRRYSKQSHKDMYLKTGTMESAVPTSVSQNLISSVENHKPSEDTDGYLNSEQKPEDNKTAEGYISPKTEPDIENGRSRQETGDSGNHAIVNGNADKKPDSDKSSMETKLKSEAGDISEEVKRETQENESDAVQEPSNLTEGEINQRETSLPSNGADYGSPTRPKPPIADFQKPSPQRMAELDRHVLSVPKQLKDFPVHELVQYLTRPTRTEVETAYVIYRWVTCHSIKQGQTTQEPEADVKEEDETVLPTMATYVEQITSGKMDHAELFSVLCKCANVESHRVTGRFRHYCPQPSPQLCRTRPAFWSAILLPGGWGFVDCTLGARHWGSGVSPGLVKEDAQAGSSAREGVSRTPNGQVSNNKARSVSGIRFGSSKLHQFQEYAPENFYFLPPPRLLVASHLPDNPHWQLLPHPVAETDFVTSLLMKPHLHYLGVDLLSPTCLVMTEMSEELEVRWRLKGDELRRFAFRFFCVSDSGSSHQDLTRYGFLENQHSKGLVTLRLTPPASGRYVCELYGSYVPTRNNEMVHMCSFDLHFVKTVSNPLKFPNNERVEWGPGAECVGLGFKPVTQIDGCFNVEKGETELVFEFSKPVLVTQKLFRAADEGQGTEVPRSTINFRDTKNRLKILLRICDPGDYVLSIFAKEESLPGKCQLVCNYLVLCDSGTPDVVHPFPSLPFNKLGPTKAFFEFDMKLVCPKKSCIVVAPYTGKVAFVFTPPVEADLSCDLQHLGQSGEEMGDTGDYVQHTSQTGESVFRARLPLAGDYLFHLYGKASDGEGHKFLLYSALIECAVPNKDCLALPRVVPDWKPRLQILAPLRKCLVLGAVTHFAVKAYKVKAMAIVGQSGVQKFTQEDDEEDERKEEEKGNENDKVPSSISESKENENGFEKQPEDENQSDAKLENTETTKPHPDTEMNTRETVTLPPEDNAAVVSHTDDPSELLGDTAKLSGDTAKLPGDTAKQSGDSAKLQGDTPKVSNETDSHQQSADQQVSSQEVTAKKGEGGEEEEIEEGWHVWRCKVKVSREDEGSGVKLCVRTDVSQDSHMVCVAEFEVITERNMTAKLHHQYSLWEAAEDRFKVRPDSGHRSHLDDQERQSAYFLDDEIYLSNPLGDENSDDDSDDLSQDEQDTYSNEEFDSDIEDTTITSGSGTDKQVKGGEVTSHAKKQDREHLRKTGKEASTKKSKKMNTKTQAERTSPTRRTFDPRTVYNVPQPTALRDSRQRNASMLREKTRYPGQRGDNTKRGQQDQKDKESRKERSYPRGLKHVETGRKDGAEGSSKTDKQKKTDGNDEHRQDAGTKERTLRRKLWSACQKREREAIQKYVTRYTRGGYPPCTDLSAAERLLHLFELRDALVKALESKDTETIRHALTEVERHGYAGEMSVVCRKAHTLLSPHRMQNKLPTLVETDMRTLMEIRSYRCPPEVVHHVMVATLLLIGVHEGLTKTWKRCRRKLPVLGPQGILQKMVKLKVDTIHPEICARARVLLDKHDLTEAQSAGSGVIAIYKWARGVVERAEGLTELDEVYRGIDHDATQPLPASRRRQREIFRQQVASTTPTSQTSQSSTNTNKTSSGLGSESPRYKMVKSDPDKNDNYRSKKDARKEEGRSPPDTFTKEGTSQLGRENHKKGSPSSNGLTERKRNNETEDSGKTYKVKTKPDQTVNPRQLNSQTQANKSSSFRADDALHRSPGHQPRPKPSAQTFSPEQVNRSSTKIKSDKTQSVHRARESPKNGTTSPESTGQRTTFASSPREGNPQQPQRSRRYNEPQERLRSLTPHKSPLFRPANKTKKAEARPRPSYTNRRPKTTPAPVLQSTFYFASLTKKGDNGEENNNLPLTFENYSHVGSRNKMAKSAGTEGRPGSMTETRLGETVGADQAPAPNGGRSISDIATPDI